MLLSRSSYLSLPSKPGVYVYLDAQGTVIYVGKAKDLKARVSSYFSSPAQLGEKTRMLVSQIEKIRVTLVESELEALLLEAFYIKKFNPKYNVRLTDNKSYVLVRITGCHSERSEESTHSSKRSFVSTQDDKNRITFVDSYPKIVLARRGDDPNSVYFGPFPSSREVRLVLKTIRRVFPFQSVMNHPKKVCLYYHLGLCPCPPVFDSPEYRKQYRKNIKKVIEIFEGSSKKIMRELEKDRDAASKEERYEDALALQKRINALGYITQPIHQPHEYDINPNLRVDLRQEEMDSLKGILIENGCSVTTLDRIECYDISHVQGSHTVASMVVFEHGEKEGSQYRKFKIRLERTPDDFASMQEVLERRMKHLEWDRPGLIIVDGGKGQVSSAMEVLKKIGWDVPLIGLAKREETIVIPIVENSKSEALNPKQIQNFNDQNRKSFEHLHLKDSSLVSNLDIRNSDLTFREVSLPRDSKALHLIMRIRDEAHRFAITYHRKLRSKAAVAEFDNP